MRHRSRTALVALLSRALLPCGASHGAQPPSPWLGGYRANGGGSYDWFEYLGDISDTEALQAWIRKEVLVRQAAGRQG
jgi:hypothetical protein